VESYYSVAGEFYKAPDGRSDFLKQSPFFFFEELEDFSRSAY